MSTYDEVVNMTLYWIRRKYDGNIGIVQNNGGVFWQFIGNSSRFTKEFIEERYEILGEAVPETTKW
jgi:hypothetical protein